MPTVAPVSIPNEVISPALKPSAVNSLARKMYWDFVPPQPPENIFSPIKVENVVLVAVGIAPGTKLALIVSALPLQIGFLATSKLNVGLGLKINLYGEVALVKPTVAPMATELGHEVEGTKVAALTLTFGVPTLS